MQQNTPSQCGIKVSATRQRRFINLDEKCSVPEADCPLKQLDLIAPGRSTVALSNQRKAKKARKEIKPDLEEDMRMLCERLRS